MDPSLSFFFRFRSESPMPTATEDCGLLAVDCVVVCCCCPCLLLQVTLFLCIRLPVKSTRIVLRRIKKRMKKNGRSRQETNGKAAVNGAQGQLCDICEGSSFVDEAEKVLQGLMVDDEGRVWVEAEKVWEELIEEEGVFWFGSFWGCDASRVKSVVPNLSMN